MNTKTNREAKKLTLRRESLRELTLSEMSQVAGGRLSASGPACQTQGRPQGTNCGVLSQPCILSYIRF